MSDSLHDAFAPLGNAPTGPSYAHPQNDEIIRDAVALLETIPEGKILIPQIKENDITIRVIIGKEPGFFVPDGHTIMIVSPKHIAGVNPFEVACNLGMAVKEIQINLVNIQRLDSDFQIMRKKVIDIILEMCKIVSEFQDVHNHLKLVDLVEKLGHGNVYRRYRSKADYKELAEIIDKSVNFEGRVK